ncbi:MAG: hypothetical protein HOP23_05560 [Methylococcaceae bacterium]|nr:hypothetical protein [Methylococcaceae bacterium]
MKIITWFILIFFSLGCSHDQLILSHREQLLLGNIGLVSINTLPEFDIDKPAEGRPAGAFRQGMNWGMQSFGMGLMGLSSGSCSGQYCGAALVLLLGLAATMGVIGGVTGSVVGALEANSPEAVQMQNREIMLKFAGMQLQDMFRANLLFNAKASNNNRLLEIQVPNCHTLDDVADVELAAKGIGTKMAATINYIGLKGDWNADPDLTLNIRSRIALRIIGTGKNFYDNEFSYKSEKRKFSEWASGNGDFLRDEINRGVLSLADQVTTKIFSQPH